MSKQQAIICDLDGTLYDARERQKVHLLSGKKDFDGFHKAAKNDPPHLWCLHLIQSMKNHGFSILFTSGRDESYRQETQIWLRKHLNWQTQDYKLWMRPDGDYTADDAMKRAWYENEIAPTYDVLFAVDDRKRVVDMWRAVGLTCLHCDEGNF